MIQIQGEINRSIELLMGRWFAPGSLIGAPLPIDTFFKKVDDTIRIATQLPK